MSDKSKIALKEEEILKFWQAKGIFEKSLEKEAPKGNFVFYDGPPFATGLPHYGSLLSSIIKDVIPRYKTMQGYRVRRRWGWDTHGLPIESLVEKKLELKTKKDIEKIGVAKFNEEAKNMVLQHAHDWEKYVERIGRWVEFKNAYKTMDNSYIESVWWAISELNKKDLLYEGRKVLMYCPHCETPLAKAEIAMDNSYKDITEEAITVKFRIKSGKFKDHFLLAWTTTPWTLPGNVALAVGKDIEYKILKARFSNGTETYIFAETDLMNNKIVGKFDTVFDVDKFKGQDLIGLEYEPLFDIPKIKESEKAYKVYAADFVNTEEGTGIVHTAVMYGEDDYQLGLKEGLPMVDLLDAGGKYNENAPEFVRGKYIKKAESEIKDDLEKRGLLFDRKDNTHSYPHCYRCGTALIYNAVSSWFINIQKIKEKLLKLNEKINWVPEHLKHGRFQNIMENAPDWTISRNRYWASPLPIWKNEKTKEIKVLGSIEELKNHTQKSGNKYFAMRHGESEKNTKGVINFKLENVFHLTDLGKKQAQESAKSFDSEKVDLILSSPFARCLETAEIVREALGLQAEVVVDDRLWEIKSGDVYEGLADGKNLEFFKSPEERFEKAPEGGETFVDLNKRVGSLLHELEGKYKDKNILVVTHAAPISFMKAISRGSSRKDILRIRKEEEMDSAYAGVVKIDFIPLPHNENYELDLHKPYIDEVELVDDNGDTLKRIPEVVDCWVESGSMPFAEWHYPFENKEEFEKRFPGDFIAEYIAQTRTWFYYMHALSIALFDSISFKNVVTTGNVLAHDGSKMSKSKGNYTDPMANFDKFGADALRLYMMGSVVMQAEDITFKDEDYRENHNRVINIFWNCFTFFETYADAGIDAITSINSDNVLDKWIISRLNLVIQEMTLSMDKYDMVKAARLVKPFVDDFSTWYVRRSRDRFKDDDLEDRKNATQTTRFVLMEFSKVISPITPFIADAVYTKLKSHSDPESIHLCEWPKGGKVDDKILENMEEVRKLVSFTLEKRMTANIKVRQPLNSLKIKSQISNLGEEYLELIKDEVNVKEVVFDEKLEGEVELDTTITPELQKEGNVRELVRFQQELRKEAGFTPNMSVSSIISTTTIGQEFINSASDQIKKSVNLKEIKFVDNEENGKEIEIGGIKFKIDLK